MFELYSVPSLTYAVDAVLSFYRNSLPSPPSSPYTASGLAISFNTSSTSVIPILNGKGIMSQAKRYVVELPDHVVFPSQREVLQDTMGIATSL